MSMVAIRRPRWFTTADKVFATMLLLQTIDIVTTLWVVTLRGVTMEANPLVRLAFSNMFLMTAIVVAKLCLAPPLVAHLYRLGGWLRFESLALCAIMGVTCVGNLVACIRVAAGLL